MNAFKLKDYNLNDTITALSTFPSKSALGIIKISGKKSLDIISKIFVPKNKKNIKKVKTHTLHYGWIVEKPKIKNKKPKSKSRDTRYDSRDTNIIDEVLISIMRAPATYTKEDVVEVSGHGGTVVLNKILELILEQGGRLALPGEFTYRALVRGRIDLLQAESILNIVEAKSEESLRAASSQLSGNVSGKIKQLKEKVKEIFIQTEALINFPEDEVGFSFPQIKKQVNAAVGIMASLLTAGRDAKILKEGAKCVICGRVNAGKSTLFNRLLKEERVLVSRVPGTTRDVIEETINIRGVPLRIYDTAGILEPKDFIAKKAIEKTARIFDQADIVILVVDGTKSVNKDDHFLLEKARDKNTILIINKIDAVQKIKIKDLPKTPARIVKLSALKNIGLKNLEEVIFKSIYKQGLDRENIVFLSQYQRQALQQASDSIGEALRFLEQGYTIDFINRSLKASLENIGKLTGEVFSEEILESIFSNFCIGK